jgi:D-methionine transport system substrate-binding protein
MCRIVVRLTVVLLITVSLLGLAACGKSPSADRKELKLGCLAYSEPMLQWIKEGLAPGGYKVEIVMFDANQLPATALKDRSIDGVIANHRPWILTFNKENNADLEMVQPYHYYSFFAIYSAKHKKLEDLPLNAQIAVPGDPTNLSRSLIILKEAGVITLKEKTGPFYTVLDIKDNPRKIRIVETEITQTVRSMQDVDALIATAYFVSEAGKDGDAYLFEDPHNKDYALGLIVRKEDVNSPWAQEAIKVLRTEQNRKRFNDQYKGKFKLFG